MLVVVAAIWDGGMMRAESGPTGDRHSGMSVRFPEAPILLEMRRGKWGHHFVRPRVEGETLGWFAVDTGTARTFINRDWARRLRLTRIGTARGMGIGGRTQQALLRIDRLELGGLEVASLPVVATDLERLNLGVGEPPAGVLGMDVLARCVLVYDQVRSRMALHDPASYVLPYGRWRTLETEHGKPAVRMLVEGMEGTFAIDTGNPGGMIIGPRAVVRWDLLRERLTQPATIGGLGGGVETQRGKLGWVEWGGKRFRNIAADFVTDGHGAAADRSVDGLIGTDLLTRFIIVIDMSHQRIAYLDRRPEEAR